MNYENDKLSDLNVENFGYELASPMIRLGAALLEGIIISVPYYLIFNNNKIADDSNFDFSDTIWQSLIYGILGAIFYSKWSGNLGHKILGLKVISSVDGTDQKIATLGATREVLKCILGIFILPSIWLLWDSKKQNLYDKITKTLVVKVEKSF